VPAPEIAVAYVSIVPEIQGFARELREQIVGPANDAGAEAGQSLGSSLRDKMKAGVAAAGVAAGALLVKGISDAIDQAHVTKKLQAQLGASNADAAKYGKVAGKLYSTGVTESFEDAAEAIKAVMQAGIAPPGATNKQLQSIATKAADVANTFDQDLGGVTNAVSQMIRTGLAKNADEAFDILTKGFQSGANKADDLLDTFNEYGTQFRKLGLDGTTALGLIQQGIKAGARDADIAADALKEFSIRAVDGSQTTADGFKALGLDADEMAKKIGKGGKSASEALDLTLDRLRGIKDPVKQSQTAVALFGTQAEDLGKALYSMDPSKATDAIGKVGGAASKLGQNLRSGPAYELDVFKRRIEQGLTEALGTYVVPFLTNVGRTVNTYFVPALKTAGDVAQGLFGFVRDNAPWLTSLAVAIGGLTLALNASAIATGIVTGVMQVYAVVVRGINLVTRAWAAGQALLNAVMSMNPIALVVIAVAALVAGLVVAYQKSETFRAIVQAAFSAIGNAALWLWNNAIKPAFSFIMTLVRILATVIVTVLVLPVVLYVKMMGAIFGWLWANAIKPALSAAGSLATWLYNKAIKPSFDFIMAVLKSAGGVATWLYNKAVKPAFQGVANVASWLYKNAVKPAMSHVNTAMHGVANVAKWLWDKGVKTPFGYIRDGVGKVASAFKSAKDTIGKQWSKVSDIAKTPISFVINTVYNRGIVGVWNKVASAFGAPKLKEFHPKGFATGGILPGYTPGRDVHRFFSPTGGMLDLSGGESIMRPEFTRAVGPGFVYGMNRIARTRGVAGVRSALGMHQAFKGGGIFGWIDDNLLGGYGSKAWEKVKAGASWLKDGIEASARAGVKHVVNPLLDRIPGLNTGFGKMVKRIPTKIVDAIFGYSKEADKKMVPNVKYNPTKGVEQWRSVVLRALAEVGQPASLANTTLRRMQQESGGNPRAVNLWDINAKNGTPSVGLMQVIGPTFRAYAGKYRNRGPFMYGVSVDPLANIYASMRYALSRYGSLSRAYNRPGGYDSGGWLMPGITPVMNAIGKPEAVLTPTQWTNIATLAERGASGGLQPGDRLVLVTDGGSFEAYVDRRADARIKSGLVDPAALGRSL